MPYKNKEFILLFTYLYIYLCAKPGRIQGLFLAFTQVLAEVREPVGMLELNHGQ